MGTKGGHNEDLDDGVDCRRVANGRRIGGHEQRLQNQPSFMVRSEPPYFGRHPR